ncbi:chemotaxis protein CheX [Falsiroseomonas tokyonensis]|uniref:Chemotaxis protein CheX n=1 Tax=Falsiroseomonas tokyonensis TaxID=430521 RepID=A0ABV7BYM3_9PROT|nr:chemotaxis protein CheX [Falsiroseomonas tokyonensis]MBU8540626.1 chemotaxis protein CheX [Falsiroseomonas tokyonensis]
MTAQIATLEDMERDALTELVNIGVSRAAVSLRKMVGQHVLLSVPSLEVVSRSGAITLIREREYGQLVAVRQDFDGAFSGRALLIFPESNSLAMVRAVAGETLTVEEASAIENEALAETGNIVLNSCLATMANMLKQPLTMSLPEVIRSNGSLLFEPRRLESGGGIVLFLYINFAINNHDIRGYISMLMDLPSIQALRLLIADFIRQVMGEEI